MVLLQRTKSYLCQWSWINTELLHGRFWPLAVDRITEILAKSIAALSREAELHNERSHMAETGQ
jgi:hypothetical protein